MGDRRLARRVLATGAAAALMLAGTAVIAPAATAYTACSTAATAQPGAKKILITGDSATNMSTGDYTWRYFLWQHFKSSGTLVDFVGSWNGTLDYIGLSDVNSHDYAACDFDWDHESRGGAKIADYNKATPATDDPQKPDYPGASSWIRGAVAAYEPDVVVEFAGFNDLYHYEEDHGNVSQGSVPLATMASNVVAQTRQYVLAVQAERPDTDILLATVPTTGTNRYTAYNAALKAAVVGPPSWLTATSTVRVVDLPSWSAHSWDGWHPDAKGDAIIADAFAKALHGLSAAYPAPGALPQPEIGPRSVSTITQVTTPADYQAAFQWTMSPNADRTVLLARDVTANGSWFVKEDLITNRYVTTLPGLGTKRCQANFLNPSVPCTTLTVGGLNGSHEYEFKLRSGKGQALATDIESASVFATVTGTPPPPKAGTATLPGLVSLEHAIKVSWAPVVGATSYRIRWRKHGASAWATAPVAGTTRTFPGLAPGILYDVAVQAIQSGALDGDYSPTASAKAKAYQLAAPAKPRLASLARHRLKAAWAVVPKASRYLVQLRLGVRVVKSVFVTKATWTSGALVAGKTYTVRVRPYDGAYGGGTSPAGSIKVK